MNRPTYIVFTNPPTRQAVRSYIQTPPEISEHPFKRPKLHIDWHTLDISSPLLVASSSSSDHASVPLPASPPRRRAPSRDSEPHSPWINSDTASSHPKNSNGSVVEATFDESSREGRRGSRGSLEAVVTAASSREPQEEPNPSVGGELIAMITNDQLGSPEEERNSLQRAETQNAGSALEVEVKSIEIVESSTRIDEDKNKDVTDERSAEQSSDLDYTSIVLPSNYQTFPQTTSSRSSNISPALPTSEQTRPFLEKNQDQDSSGQQDARECSIIHSTRLEDAFIAPEIVTTTVTLKEPVRPDIAPSINAGTKRLDVPNPGIDSTSLDINSVGGLSTTSFSFTVAPDVSADIQTVNSLPVDKDASQNSSSKSREMAQQTVFSASSLVVRIDPPLETSPAAHSTYSFQTSTESSFLPTQADTQPRPSDPSVIDPDQAHSLHPGQPQTAHPTHPYIHPNLLRSLPTFTQPLDESAANFLTVVTSVELKSFVGKDGRSWLLGELELFDGRNVGRLTVWGEEAREWCDGVGIRKGDVVLFERITIVRPKPPSPIQTLQAYPQQTSHLQPGPGPRARARTQTQPVSTYTVFYRTAPPLPGESAEEWASKRADLRWRTSDTGLGLVGKLKDWVESAGV